MEIPLEGNPTTAETAAQSMARTRDGRVFHAAAGMEVLGADGVRVGQVKGARPTDILVDRALKRDVYVPFEAVQDVRENQIILTVPADQVDSMNWPRPPLLSTEQGV